MVEKQVIFSTVVATFPVELEHLLWCYGSYKKQENAVCDYFYRGLNGFVKVSLLLKMICFTVFFVCVQLLLEDSVLKLYHSCIMYVIFSSLKFQYVLLGDVYGGGCEVLPCRTGPGLGPSTQSGHHLQGPQT